MAMIFRQLFDPKSSTYTYLLGCPETRKAVLIDTVYEQFNRDAALIRELGLKLVFVLDTHVHADHVTGAWRMKDALGARIVLSAAFGAEGVDVGVSDGDVISFGRESLTVIDTHGHTNGCVTYVTADRTCAFTGDSLMIRGAGRTDFQSGNVEALWQSIRERLFSLPDNCIIYPGHDYHGRQASSVAEEKAFNPRIGGDARKEDFVGYMNNLGLPHPKLLDMALPANMKSGRPDTIPDDSLSWAPIAVNFAGITEVDPDWVASHRDEVTVIDVRSRAEYDGELGHLAGSISMPLDELRNRMAELPGDQPVVAVCQTGKRSALAVQQLQAAGFEKVANVPGGMVHWNRMALPTGN